jgi:hypothetical protein
LDPLPIESSARELAGLAKLDNTRRAQIEFLAVHDDVAVEQLKAAAIVYRISSPARFYGSQSDAYRSPTSCIVRYGG